MLERDSDSVSDCYLYVCEHLHRNEYRRLRHFQSGGPASFRTWLFLVARNLVLDGRRKEYARNRPLTAPSHSPRIGEELISLLRIERQSSQTVIGENSPEDIPDGRPDPESQTASTEMQSLLENALTRLDGPSRFLIQLRFEQGLTLDQVAKIAGLADAQTADRRIRSILGVLRKQIG
jgi:RNA polymerase sigma factor (sigma-70 family)